MKQFVRDLLLSIGLIILIGFLCGAGFFLDVWLYPTVGRINDFQAVKDGTNLDGTHYTITVKVGQVGLQNSVTHQITLINGGNRYRLLSHKGNVYFIEFGQTGGSGDLLDFNIYNITTDQPWQIGEDTYPSCAYPRLDGDVLEFEQGEHCEFFPLFGGSTRSYTVALT